MPRKVHELRAELRKEGVTTSRQAGSHETWDTKMPGIAIHLAGHGGVDAKDYQEKQVRESIRAVRAALKGKQP